MHKIEITNEAEVYCYSIRCRAFLDMDACIDCPIIKLYENIYYNQLMKNRPSAWTQTNKTSVQ